VGAVDDAQLMLLLLLLLLLLQFEHSDVVGGLRENHIAQSVSALLFRHDSRKKACCCSPRLVW
jgi:hypothetical protein